MSYPPALDGIAASHHEPASSGASCDHCPLALQKAKVIYLQPSSVSECADQGGCSRYCRGVGVALVFMWTCAPEHTRVHTPPPLHPTPGHSSFLPSKRQAEVCGMLGGKGLGSRPPWDRLTSVPASGKDFGSTPKPALDEEILGRDREVVVGLEGPLCCCFA